MISAILQVKEVTMGLDIDLATDRDPLYAPAEHDIHFKLHNLSREFCNFMCRRHVVDDPELDQIGSITGIDISPLYDMDQYPGIEETEGQLEYAETEEEKQDLLKDFEERKAKVQGNIGKILQIVTSLIEKLNSIDSLPSLLKPNDFDSIGIETYFTDFQIDKGEGYIGNNFGQDLRNFKRFLEFAKARGATTVWFTYG
jgi:hypothetical protein